MHKEPTLSTTNKKESSSSSNRIVKGHEYGFINFCNSSLVSLEVLVEEFNSSFDLRMEYPFTLNTF